MKGQALRGHHSPDRALRQSPREPDPSTDETEVGRLIAHAVSLGLRPRSARRLVTHYLQHAQTNWDFTTYVLTYADPTGEKATYRALRHQVRRFA